MTTFEPQPFLVGGAWETGDAAATVTDPSTGVQIGSVAVGGPADAARAVDGAAIAQVGWAAASPRERSEVLRKSWELISNDPALPSLITSEHGKPLSDARGEVAYAAEFFRWNAEEAVRIGGSMTTSPSGSNRILVRHPPVGVVVIVTPWNFPAAMITRKVAPALAAGNAVVIKPALETPLTALRLGELFLEAGVPPGVVNIIPTTDPGGWFDAAIGRPAARMVSFTGSTDTGCVLLRKAADRVLKVGMELGGNAPFVVFADADLDRAVEGAMVAKMRHSAETCTAANRFFVDRAVADDFTERLAAAMSAVVTGPGIEPASECGPMISKEARDRVAALVDGARDRGAKVVVGGSALDRPGFFYAPTVLGDVSPDDSITHHEIFGPVAPVIPFDDTDEMLAEANRTEVGLAAYVDSGDIGRGLAVGERLDAGMVGINRGAMSDPAAPFGGMKQSGLGREGGSDGILEFCETQYLAVDW